MKKRILSMLLAVMLIVCSIPMTAMATEPECAYISISYDGQFLSDKDGTPIAYYPVSLTDLASIDLNEYGLNDYLYDADSDGTYEITALHLCIYIHEVCMGMDWSDVTFTGSPGSSYFAGGLFGFDENLRYDLNGKYPVDEALSESWGYTVGATSERIVLSDGDFLDMASFSCWGFYSDDLTGFRYFGDENGDITHAYATEVGTETQVKLIRTYSSWAGEGIADEAYSTVYYGTEMDTATGTVETDDNGCANITFPSAGTWYVWSDGGHGTDGMGYHDSCDYYINNGEVCFVSSPAYAKVTVEGPAGPSAEDVEAADAVEEKIAAIGTVNIFSGAKITAATEAFDALTDTQKSLVENKAILDDAKTTLAGLYEEAAGADHEAIYNATDSYLETLGTPTVGSIGGEWMVIDLTRAGNACPDGYYENVVEYVNEKINDKEQLHRAKSTDNSRVILGLTSAGYDVTNVDGHNLLFGLTDMNYLKKQGINGPIWALIAFDCYDYEIPTNPDAAQQVTREGIIDYILSMQHDDGGWSLQANVTLASDPDMTGMAIQALAPYYDSNADVKAAVDEALVMLSDIQNDIGGYGSIDGVCTESCAQVIVALTALGIDPETDSRFVKNGISVLDAMCIFAVEDGGFAHVPNGGLNGMATEQGQYALASYFRFKNDQTSLYDMTDVTVDYIPNLKKHTDGNWYLFAGNEIMTDYTGFAENEYGTWYVEEGKVTFTKNDVIKDVTDGKWKYVVNSKFTETDTVAKNANGWWRIEDGIVNFGATGVYKNENGWWYCKDGQVQFGYTGIQKNENGWWRIVNGKVDFSATGVYQNENGWWYCKDGKVQFDYTGVQKNENGWWRIESGKVNFNFTGIASNEYGSWYLVNGKVDFSKNGKVTYGGKAYTVKAGKVI